MNTKRILAMLLRAVLTASYCQGRKNTWKSYIGSTLTAFESCKG